ncbi:MAG: ATP-binding protein, partial [Candidatus Omnitrophota bacterium]|nr:ATP-binding protein [Candidatus Omnitrophota bacterium]
MKFSTCNNEFSWYTFTMIKRDELCNKIKRAFRYGRVVAVLGPRQCGKTTLARQFIHPDSEHYFDLEDPAGAARLAEPMNALAGLKGTVVIDEIQRQPELFPILRVLADRKPLPAKFLILGSASPEIARRSSESLAGRIARIKMTGFTLSEVGAKASDKLWLRGGFPISFLAKIENESISWRKDFIHSFVERDLPAYGMTLPPVTLLRFWTMLAHYHGQILNVSEIAGSLGVNEVTVKRYTDILSGVFMVRQLQPFHANIKKRQVKSPKIYIRDTGVLHNLLGIRTMADLLGNPKCGASWEGYVVEEMMQLVEPDEAYFWATHNKAEIDLMFIKNGRRYGVECKRADAPRLTPSMKIAMKELRLES